MVKLALVLASAYAFVAVAAFIAQRKLMYFPDRTRVSPASFALAGVEERVLQTPDGEALVAWFGRADAGPARRSFISTAMPATSPTAPSACANTWRAGSASSC